MRLSNPLDGNTLSHFAGTNELRAILHELVVSTQILGGMSRAGNPRDAPVRLAYALQDATCKARLGARGETERRCTMPATLWLLCAVLTTLITSSSQGGEAAIESAVTTPQATAELIAKPVHPELGLVGALVSGKLFGARGQQADPSAGQAPAFPLLAADPDRLPAEVVRVRISRDLLANQFERAISRHDLVVDTILDTPVQGNALTVGATEVTLQPSSDGARVVIRFAGTVSAQTQGYKGPVVFDSEAVTRFTARKELLITAKGVRVAPSICVAETSSTSGGVQVNRPGVRGRIIERVARRKLEETRDEANSVVAEHAAAQINKVFDQEVASEVAPLDVALRSDAFRRALGSDEHTIYLTSSPGSIDLVVRRNHAREDERGLLPPAMTGDAQLGIRAHRVVVRRLMASAHAAGLKSLVVGLLADQGDNPPAAGIAKECHFKWSPDRNWLVMDYERPKPQLAPATAEPVAPSPIPPMATAQSK